MLREPDLAAVMAHQGLESHRLPNSGDVEFSARHP